MLPGQGIKWGGVWYPDRIILVGQRAEVGKLIVLYRATNKDAYTNRSRFLIAIGEGRFPRWIEERYLLGDLYENFRPLKGMFPEEKLTARFPGLDEWMTRWLRYDP